MKQTSREAYERVKPKRNEHHRAILNVLSHYEKGLTGFDISEHCNLSYHQVMRRMSELEELGKIETTEKDLKQRRMKYRLIKVDHLEVEFEEVN